MKKIIRLKPHLWWLWLCFILVVSVIPSNNTHSSNWVNQFHLDKLFHLLSHAIAIFLIGWALNTSKSSVSKNIKYSFVVLFMIVFGILIECIQGVYVPGRVFDIADIIANSIGDLLGVCLLFSLWKKLQQ